MALFMEEDNMWGNDVPHSVGLKTCCRIVNLKKKVRYNTFQQLIFIRK